MVTAWTQTSREHFLASTLSAALPNWRVRAMLGNPMTARELDRLRPPEILLTLDAIVPSVAGEGQGGDVAEWSAWIVARNLRSHDALRLSAGSEAALVDVALSVRQTLAGLISGEGSSPLVPRGGTLVREGAPVALWREQFREAIRPPGLRAPVFCSTVEWLAELEGFHPIETNSFTLPGETSLPAVGEHLLAEADSPHGFHDLGPVQSADVSTIETAYGLEEDATGLNLYVAGDAVKPAVLAASGSALRSIPNATITHDLTGGSSVALLGAQACELDSRFAPMREADAETFAAAMRSLERVPRFVAGNLAGGWWRASVREPLRLVSQAHTMAAVEIRLRLAPLESLAELITEDSHE